MLACGMAAVLALAGCSTDVETIKAPTFTPKPRCPKTLTVSRNAIEPALMQVKDQDGYTVLDFSDTLLTPTLTLGRDEPSRTVEAAAVTKAIGSTLACTDMLIVVNQPELLAVLPLLGMAKVAVELRLTEEQLKDQPWLLTVLGYTANLTELTLVGDVAPKQLPRLESVAMMSTVNKALEPDFESMAKRLPNLEVLSVGIDQDADWEPADLAGLTTLTTLNLTLFPEDSLTDLGGVSKETMDLILQIPETLPDLVTLNGQPAGEVTQASLAPGSILTRAERKAEEAAKIATTDLQDWGESIRDGDWATGGSAGTITGPVLIYNEVDGGNSAANGVRGEDWNGIPAANLCLSKDECASVIVVDHRSGAVSGYYVPTSGSGSSFNGHLGETTVTVYDAGASLIRPVVVAASTSPPDTVYSEAEAIGAPDVDKAWSLINDRLG